MTTIGCVYHTQEAILLAFGLLYKTDDSKQYIRDMGMFESAYNSAVQTFANEYCYKGALSKICRLAWGYNHK